ncbi:hypothetical protein ACFOLK_04755 [Marinococcus halophilus]|uniref:Uncharacterized protein n=1 Tax=Marinococcus halophilus TaxID=1371 RepID=A0A510Y5R6_MARHA|nr:hypothetical protein MHA01_16150 [Marinococcus halophilus]
MLQEENLKVQLIALDIGLPDMAEAVKERILGEDGANGDFFYINMN